MKVIITYAHAICRVLRIVAVGQEYGRVRKAYSSKESVGVKHGATIYDELPRYEFMLSSFAIAETVPCYRIHDILMQVEGTFLVFDGVFLIKGAVNVGPCLLHLANHNDEMTRQGGHALRTMAYH